MANILHRSQEIQNHALHTLFNLCRLSKARQEEAASFGAIPILQKIVTANSPLKQFALPILCDFAHLDSRITRKLSVTRFFRSSFPLCRPLTFLSISQIMATQWSQLLPSPPLERYILDQCCSRSCTRLVSFLSSLFPSTSTDSIPPANLRLQDELARVEDCLLEPSAVESLVQLFCKTKSAVFETMLEPFHKVGSIIWILLSSFED